MFVFIILSLTLYVNGYNEFELLFRDSNTRSVNLGETAEIDVTLKNTHFSTTIPEEYFQIYVCKPQDDVFIEMCRGFHYSRFDGSTNRYYKLQIQIDSEDDFGTRNVILFHDSGVAVANNTGRNIKRKLHLGKVFIEYSDEFSEKNYHMCFGLENHPQVVNFNKRPVCPSVANNDTISHEAGFLSIYKRNIETATSEGHSCFLKVAYVRTVFQFFGWKNWNSRSVQVSVSPEECKSWVRTKRCEFEFDNERHSSGMLRETGLHTWSTTNEVTPKYSWCRTRNYKVYNCVIQTISVYAAHPYQQIRTPLGALDPKYLYRDSFRGETTTLVWNPLTNTDTCSFVLWKQEPTEKVTFGAGDERTYIKNLNRDEIYYVRDSIDLSQFSNIDCIEGPQVYDFYLYNDQLLLAFISEEQVDNYLYTEPTQNISNESEPSPVRSLLHGIIKDNRDAYLHNRELRRTLNEGGHHHLSKSVGLSLAHHDPTTYVQRMEEKQKRQKRDVVQTFQLDALDVKLVNYTLHHALEEAMKWCENDKLIYDLQLGISVLDPSVMASSYLKRPVKLFPQGDYYALRKCKTILADKITLVPTLKTNDPKLVDFLKSHDVPIDPDMCLDRPIGYFTDNDTVIYGQLMKDKYFKVAPQLYSRCTPKAVHFFEVGDYLFLYENHVLKLKFPLEELSTNTGRVGTLKEEYVIGSPVGDVTREHLKMMLNSIKSIDIFTTETQHEALSYTPFGFSDNTIYTLEEKNSVINTFQDMMSEVSKNKEHLAYFKQSVELSGVINRTQSSSFNVADIFTTAGEAIGGFFGGAVSGVIKGFGAIMASIFDNLIFRIFVFIGSIGGCLFVIYFVIDKILLKSNVIQTLAPFPSPVNEKSDKGYVQVDDDE